MHDILCLKSCLFDKAKLIKHMLNSLFGASHLVLKKHEFSKHKMFQSYF